MLFALIHSAMRMLAIILVMLCGGCGAPVPDESAGLQSPPMVSTSQAEKGSTPHSLVMGDTAMVEKKIERNVNGDLPVNQSERGTPVSISPIPPSVAKDLQSPEGRDRYRALDYWEAKDRKAPLDPVFEALEDEDEAVRAKATAIVEQYWAVEQEKEKN
jgi:hypothetical protein